MASTATQTLLRSPLFFLPSSSLNPSFHSFSKQPPSYVSFPSLSLRNPKPIRLTSHSPIVPIIAAAKPTSTLTGSTRSLATLVALTIAITKIMTQKLTPVLGDALRYSLHTTGPVFFASLRDGPTGSLNKPLTVVAVGINKWLDVYINVLMVRVLLGWFPNLPWDRQPFSAIRSLCDPYLNLFRDIVPLIYGTYDVSPWLAFGVLGTLGSIVHGSTG